jgi:hypothetical protein
MAKKTVVKLLVGHRVKHPKYGPGTVTDTWRSRLRTTNASVKFDSGGPLGWADKATHDIKDLMVV